jgi:hypothetical protein
MDLGELRVATCGIVGVYFDVHGNLGFVVGSSLQPSGSGTGKRLGRTFKITGDRQMRV